MPTESCSRALILFAALLGLIATTAVATEASAQLLGQEWLEAQAEQPCLLVDSSIDGAGLITVTGIHAWEYNAAGDKGYVLHWYSQGLPTERVDYLYDADGTYLGRRVEGPRARESAVTLDEAGRVVEERFSSADGTSVSRYWFDEAGRRIREEHDWDEDGLADQIATSTLADGTRVAGEVTYRNYPEPGTTTVAALAYHYDDEGRPIAEAELVDGELVEIWRFGYDEQSRLSMMGFDDATGARENQYYYGADCVSMEAQLSLSRAE